MAGASSTSLFEGLEGTHFAGANLGVSHESVWQQNPASLVPALFCGVCASFFWDKGPTFRASQGESRETHESFGANRPYTLKFEGVSSLHPSIKEALAVTDFVGFSSKAAVSCYTSPTGPCRNRRASTVRGVARQATSQKVKRNMGVWQLHLRVSRCVCVCVCALSASALSKCSTDTAIAEKIRNKKAILSN